MTTKRLLGIVLAISSLALLAAAVSTAAPTAKRGGTIVIEISTDVDYIDPQLSLLRRDVEARGRDGLQADELAGQGRRAGAVATPEVARGPPDHLARRQDVHVHDQAGLPLLERQAGHREKLRRLVQPLREPADAVDRRRSSSTSSRAPRP